jgi:hypothetical protein
VAWFAWLGFTDREGTALEVFAVEALNSGLRRTAVWHVDEPKAFGAAGVPVGNKINLVHRPIRLEELAQVMIGGGIRQIPYIDIHGKSFILKGMETIRQVIRRVRRSEMQTQYAGRNGE